MRPIGGFFELELPRHGTSPHPDAIALSTGRACLTVILDEIKPTLVHVPFHACDALLQPFRRLRIEIAFYGLADDLSPLALPELGPREHFLWTDYYGVCGEITERLKMQYGDKLIIDDTHAFYRGRHPGHWSFTCARKYFGVPDGAYLFAPKDMRVEAPPFERISLQHGLLRALGRQDEAYAAYQAYEATLNCEVYRISETSESLLNAVDHEQVKSRRRENFEYLHARLGPSNTLPMGSAPKPYPFCYPYLPERSTDRSNLYANGLFIPRLWPDVLTRTGDGFEREKRWSQDLLPLPIDHRYGESEMERLAEFLMNT